MLEVRFSPEALRDFEAIAVYTIERFGITQATTYADSLMAAIDRLAESPRLGTDQGHISTNARRLVHEHHSIYYEITDRFILVLRILGPGQDPILEFARDSM